MQPIELRKLISEGKFARATAGVCEGYVQTNLVALPKRYKDDFQLFCEKNPKAIPLLEVVEDGCRTSFLAKDANLLNELPLYNIIKNGKVVKQVKDISDYYDEDLVFFLIGCSFTFENSLMEAGIELRHVQNCQNVSMYNTSIELNQVGDFKGKMVVSMRPIKKELIKLAYEVTSHYPKMHGSPIHHGDPKKIGIDDISKVDYGDAVEIKDDEEPVFWPCGVTPQNVLRDMKIPFAITHSPGHMFVTDRKDSEFYLP